MDAKHIACVGHEDRESRMCMASSTSFFFHIVIHVVFGFDVAVYVREGSNIFYTVLLEGLLDLFFPRLSPTSGRDGRQADEDADDDNAEAQLTNDNIKALLMIGNGSLFFKYRRDNPEFKWAKQEDIFPEQKTTHSKAILRSMEYPFIR
ncbi:hypothetical protein EI94DRAFT_1705001 [Lactarius quietus]|nr:hypothetical protein EI94DRAFT_1705001 [Lactarius quietus]